MDSPPKIPVRVYSHDGVGMTIHIRTDIVVFLAQRIHADELSDGGVVLPGTVVIPVQPVHPIKFLAIVFVSLQSLLRALVMGHTIRIIMRGLLDRTCVGCHNAVVPLMVLEIEAVGIA